MPYRLLSCCVLALCLSGCATPQSEAPDPARAPATRTVGALTYDGMPAPEARIAQRLKPYLDTRSATFFGFSAEGAALISTRFAETDQLHRVASPGAAREQLTFTDGRVLWAADVLVDARNLLVYQSDTSGGEAYQLVLLDSANGSQRALTTAGSRNESPVLSHDRQRIAYASNARNGVDFDIIVQSMVASAPAQKVLQRPGMWFPLDFSGDGNRLLVQNYRSITDSQLWELDLRDGSAKELLPADERASRAAARYDIGGRGVYLLTDQRSEWMKLYLLDASGALQPVGNEEEPYDIEDFALSPDGKRIAFLRNVAGTSALFAYEIEPYTEIGRMTIDYGVMSNLHFSPDSASVGFSLSGAKTPGDVFSLSLPEQSLSRWTFGEVGGLPRNQFVEPTLEQYGTFDKGIFGLDRQLTFFQYRPAGAGPFPVLIIMHGGPESQSRPGFSGWIQFMAREMGVMVLLPNVRGSSGFGKSFLAADDGPLRGDSVEDMGYLIGWAKAQSYIDKERIVVTGGSYGGFMSLSAATRFSDHIAGAVSTVGISHLATFLENTSEYRRDQRRMEYGDERDPTMRALMDELAPLRRADQIKKPLFVLQGANDPRVPRSESLQIVAAARAAGAQTWYLEAANEGHGFRRKENQLAAQVATVQFFEQVLLAGRRDGGPERVGDSP